MEKELAQSNIPVRRKIPKTTQTVTFLVVFWTLDSFLAIAEELQLKGLMGKASG